MLAQLYLWYKRTDMFSIQILASWGEREQVTAFRVCVSANERSKIMDPQLRAHGVVIRD